MRVLGTEHASRYLAPGGLWHQWTEGPPRRLWDPEGSRQVVAQLCSFASECAALFAVLQTGR
ncbi:DUF6000 family protein [Streptomyces canus]|uniref:DUF6000 family protein n=1 Tax=Streptomyces canus TaxID=58343 RepID=UPI00338FF150